MPTTEIITVPMQHRGAILNHRDNLQTIFGVTMVFPRDKCWGAYQELHISGFSGDIRKVSPIIGNIVDEAQANYEAFRERKASRERRNNYYNQTTTSSATNVPEKKPVSNLFSILDVDTPEPVEEFPVLGNPKTKEVPSWGPRVNQSEVVKPLGDWGDESDDE